MEFVPTSTVPTISKLSAFIYKALPLLIVIELPEGIETFSPIYALLSVKVVIFTTGLEK